MHSKTPFKFLFKSAKISTVSVKTIFFLNTTLPKEHYQIYFTNFGCPELNLPIFKVAHKTKNECTGFFPTVADNRDPLVSRSTW